MAVWRLWACSSCASLLRRWSSPLAVSGAMGQGHKKGKAGKQKKRKTNDRERDEASREKAARPRKRPRADRGGGGEAEDSLSERKRAAKLDDLTDVESFFDAVEQGVDLSVRRRLRCRRGAALRSRSQPLTRANGVH